MSSDILTRLHTTVSNTNPYFGNNTKVIRKNNKEEYTQYVLIARNAKWHHFTTHDEMKRKFIGN